jgi:hypothetical protein
MIELARQPSEILLRLNGQLNVNSQPFVWSRRFSSPNMGTTCDRLGIALFMPGPKGGNMTDLHQPPALPA